MKYNFHTHSYRCGHADGTDEEYVLKAIENGYDVIGFSDHAPYLFPPQHHSGFRMSVNQIDDYVSSVRALQEKYKSQIQIKLGFEVEYYPDLIDRELEFLKKYNYDYIILAQHYTDNEYEDYAVYTGSATTDEQVLDKYINQLIQGAKSGEFLYVCHPDLIKFTGNHDLYISKMTYMIKELKKIGIPLEFNFYGYFDNRNYPNPEIWKIIAQEKNPVVIGLDAHNPEVYAMTEKLSSAKQFLSDLGITPIKEMEF